MTSFEHVLRSEDDECNSIIVLPCNVLVAATAIFVLQNKAAAKTQLIFFVLYRVSQ